MPAVTRYYRAEFEEARASHEAALARFEDRERTKFWTAYTGHNGSVTHRCYLALDLWHLGYPDQALRMVRETLELARDIGHPYSLGHAVDFTAYLNGYCRFGVEMQAAAEEEIAIGTEQGFPLWHALGILHKGAGMLMQGRSEEGLPLLLKGYRAFRATGAQVRVPTYLGMLGEAYTQCGRFDEAHEALKEALAVAEKNDDRSHEAELYRFMGELMLAESRDEGAAETHFRQAIETARRQQSRVWELRATMSLTRMWRWQGRGEEARAALGCVYAMFTEGFATPDLIDAVALLESVS
jgi:predicted ATPase